MPHSAEEKKRVITRLRRIRGQAEALERAVESGTDCGALLQQLSALRGATTQMGASLAVARSQPLQRDALAALTAARSVLDATWRTVVTEADGPDAKAMLAPWSIRWEEHHTQIDQAVQVINHAAEQHDAAIHQFPARVLAWVFGFKAAKGL